MKTEPLSKSHRCLSRATALRGGLERSLTPELRAWIDNVIVPALVGEWTARESSPIRVAGNSPDVAEFELESHSTEAIR